MGFDLLIQNATVVDGTGGARYQADVGVVDGVITEIGRIRAQAQRTIHADGLILSPGFIDGHTHMDAQVAWDSLGSCSCWHGVTSVMMGNCGFALAPCKPDEREWFARCLEAVEDIPTDAMMTGIDWSWETFPEYLENLERLPKGINYGAYLVHSALRMYAMGERGVSEVANEADLKRMRALVAEAMRAGAVGFSTSRSPTHVTPDRSPIASRIADWTEIDALVSEMASFNAGVFQIGPDVSSGQAHREFLMRLRKVALECRRPVMFATAATRQGGGLLPWEAQLAYVDETVAAGGRMFAQTTTRSINALFSFHSYLPFDQLPSWKAIRSLPIEEQKSRLRDPELRRKLVADEANMRPRDNVFQGGGAATTDPRRPDYGNLYVLKGVDWDDPTVEELAKARGVHPVEAMIDVALENDFDQFFLQPLINEEPDHVHGMLKHPRALATFSDSGAHVCQEMGSSLPTHMLNYWVRDQQAFSLEEAVRMLSFDNACAWELHDRGLVRPGFVADLVLFEDNGILPCLPTVEYDLPGGARRLVQKAEGIAATIVNGQVALENGESTGVHAGQVIRGAAAD